MMESEIWLNCRFFRVYQHFFISVGKCPREWIIASLQICIWPNQARIVLVTAYWNTRKEGKEYHPSENEEMINYDEISKVEVYDKLPNEVNETFEVMNEDLNDGLAVFEDDAAS